MSYSQFRRYGQFPRTLRNVDLPIAHKKDPRVRAPAFNPAAHSEEAQFAQLRSGFDQRYEPMETALDSLDPLNIPSQLQQTAFRALIPVPGTFRHPVLLIPANTRRMSWSIAGSIAGSPNVTLFYSFGAPSGGVGLPLVGITGESNGSVSIDDIWVWTSLALGGGGIIMLGYEGTLALYGRHIVHGGPEQ